MLVRPSEFARMAGVSWTAISKAIKSGKIETTSRGKINTDNPTAIAYLESKKIESLKNEAKIKLKITDNKENNKELTGRDRSLANLRPSTPGQTNNSNGAPKGKRFSTLLDKLLNKGSNEITEYIKEETLDKFPNNMPLIEIVIRIMVLNAIKGDTKSQQLIIERLEGKPFQTIQNLPSPPTYNMSRFDDGFLKEHQQLYEKHNIDPFAEYDQSQNDDSVVIDIPEE